MFKSSIKVKGSKKDIINKISNSLPVAMEKVMQYAQEEALKQKRGSKDSDLIPYEIINNNKEVIGRLYTNFDYAPFLEYGTGIKADGTLPHIGKTKKFVESGMRIWYLPKALADAKGREFSPQRIINIGGEEFYIMYATEPFPFMRPTAFLLEDNAIKILADEIIKQLKE